MYTYSPMLAYCSLYEVDVDQEGWAHEVWVKSTRIERQGNINETNPDISSFAILVVILVALGSPPGSLCDSGYSRLATRRGMEDLRLEELG